MDAGKPDHPVVTIKKIMKFFFDYRFAVNYLSDENDFSKAGSKSRVPVG